MTITIEDRPSTLLELLWIREAYDLHPHGEDLPPLLIDTPPAALTAAVGPETRGEWEGEWPSVWHSAVAHASADFSSALHDAIQSTEDGSRERIELFRQIIGPDWRDTFDDAFAGAAYSDWSERDARARMAETPVPLEEHPERRDLATLIPAWRAGLTKIVTIPCAGEFTRKVNDSALLMTEATRHDSDRYRRALSSFI